MASHLVLGGSGFLGRSLLRALGERGIGTYDRNPFCGGLRFQAPGDRLKDLGKLPGDLSHVFVLHGIASPDICFRESARTQTVNVLSMIEILKEAFAMGWTPVYMSTDYVFDGTRGGRTEEEKVSPITNYGRQKAEVEAWLGNQAQPYIICRASKIVSGDANTHSVIGQWAIDLVAGKPIRCAIDQVFSPGYVDDIARTLVALADHDHRGIFHVAGLEAFSRYALARLFSDHVVAVNPLASVRLSKCRLAEIPFAEPRPLDTSLSIKKLRRTIELDFMTMDALCRQVAQTNFAPFCADRPSAYD